MARAPRRELQVGTVRPTISTQGITPVTPSRALPTVPGSSGVGEGITALSSTLAQALRTKREAEDPAFEAAAIAIGQRVNEGMSLEKAIAEYTESGDTPRQLASRIRKMVEGGSINATANPFFARAYDATLAEGRGRQSKRIAEAQLPAIREAFRRTLAQTGDEDAARAAAEGEAARLIREDPQFQDLYDGLGEYGSTVLRDQIGQNMSEVSLVAAREAEAQIINEARAELTAGIADDITQLVEIANGVEDFMAVELAIEASLKDTIGKTFDRLKDIDPDPEAVMVNIVDTALQSILQVEDPDDRLDMLDTLQEAVLGARSGSKAKVFKDNSPAQLSVLRKLTASIQRGQQDRRFSNNNRTLEVEATFEELLNDPALNKARADTTDTENDNLDKKIQAAPAEQRPRLRQLVQNHRNEVDRRAAARKQKGVEAEEPTQENLNLLAELRSNPRSILQTLGLGISGADVSKAALDKFDIHSTQVPEIIELRNKAIKEARGLSFSFQSNISKVVGSALAGQGITTEESSIVFPDLSQSQITQNTIDEITVEMKDWAKSKGFFQDIESGIIEPEAAILEFNQEAQRLLARKRGDENVSRTMTEQDIRRINEVQASVAQITLENRQAKFYRDEGLVEFVPADGFTKRDILRKISQRNAWQGSASGVRQDQGKLYAALLSGDEAELSRQSERFQEEGIEFDMEGARKELDVWAARALLQGKRGADLTNRNEYRLDDIIDLERFNRIGKEKLGMDPLDESAFNSLLQRVAESDDLFVVGPDGGVFIDPTQIPTAALVDTSPVTPNEALLYVPDGESLEGPALLKEYRDMAERTLGLDVTKRYFTAQESNDPTRSVIMDNLPRGSELFNSVFSRASRIFEIKEGKPLDTNNEQDLRVFSRYLDFYIEQARTRITNGQQ